MKDFVLRVVDIYKPFRYAILVVFAFMICSQALMLASPYIYGKIIDGIIEGNPINDVLMLTFLAFAIFILQSVIINYYQEKFELANLNFDISRHVSKKTLTKVLSFSVGQHNNQNSGVKQSIIDRGEHSLTTLAYTMLYEVFPLALQVVLTIVALLYLSITLGLIVLVGTVVFICFTIYLNLNFKDKLKEFENMRHEHNKVQTEILRNIELIQISAQEKRAVREHDKSFAKISIFGKKMWTKFTLFAVLRNLTTGVSRFAVMVVGVYYVYEGFYTPGYLVIFLTWSSNAFGNLGRIGPIHRRCIEMYTAVKKYFVMLDVDPEVKVIKNPVRSEKFGGRIEFKEVSFKYPTRTYLDDDEVKASMGNNCKDTLSNLNFVIEEGQKVAFVGHSGAGKATIVHLLTRAYDPDHGQIIIDQNDLRVMDLAQYRESIGLVEQSVALFDNTLRYNITFGLNGRSVDITNDNLSDVAKLSCIDKFSNRLEKGFDTIIGEKGVRLSGGERQRVGIARALIKNPQFLIFDEATSNLDTENESLIRQSIEEASHGRTTILIAHRLSTIKDADKIFVMDKGRIVGEGAHEDLLESCDKYKALVNHQVVTV